VGDGFLAPGSGLVLGRRATARAAALDAALDARAALLGEGQRLDRAALRAPGRRVLALAVERTNVPNLLGPARRELHRSRHAVTVATRPAGGAGKFANLDALLAEHPPDGYDWLLVLDDDVALPACFLDRFLVVCERFAFALAQPAHRHASHAAWPLTRRHPGVARRTRFVEIGPVTAFHRDVFADLLPFPDLRMGWGLDAHWSAVAAERGLPVGIVDATPVRHLRAVAGAYPRDEAMAEAEAFLDGRAYVTREQAGETLAEHRAL